MSALIDARVSLGAEWDMLELLCSGLGRAEEQQAFARLINEVPIQWGEVLEQALQHKVAHLLAYFLTAGVLDFDPLKIPRYVKKALLTLLQANRYELTMLKAEARTVSEAFQRANIPAVVTKGIVFEPVLYGGKGTRSMGDLDFMIPPAYADQAISALNALGYQAGHYDLMRDAIMPMSRKDMLIYKSSPDHLPKFARMTGDMMCRSITIDIASSFTWARSKYHVPLEDAFATMTVEPHAAVEGQPLPVFQPEYHFIFTVLHFFREAWIIRHMDSDKDVNLIKCVDIMRFWETYPELRTRSFGKVLEKYAVVDPVLWVLEHIDRTFGTRMVPVLEIDTPPSEAWLFSASTNATGDNLLAWNVTMRERLRRKDRRQLFSPA